jgi:GTP-binding protein
MLKINAKFITSAAVKSQFIESDKPIIAVCGKSNVGKSSFINMLANQKKLAKVSQEPGRTRLINYFDFGQFILADLPGYGYAKVSKAEKEKWAKMLDDFFAEKDKIAHVFALCDSRHDPTEDDKLMVNYLYYHLIPFTVVATKADKLSKMKVKQSMSNIASIYKCGVGDIVATSSVTRLGLDEVFAEIEKVIELNSAAKASGTSGAFGDDAIGDDAAGGEALGGAESDEKQN